MPKQTLTAVSFALKVMDFCIKHRRYFIKIDGIGLLKMMNFALKMMAQDILRLKNAGIPDVRARFQPGVGHSTDGLVRF